MATVTETHRNAQILLIEDNRGDAMLTRRAFGKAKSPSDVVVADTAEKGLRMLRREGEYGDAPRPDIILLDLNLPSMHGYEFLSAVKNDPQLQCIPVVVLSSSSASSDISGSYSRHANGYITKPSALDAFDDIVSKIEGYWFQLMQLPLDVPPRVMVAN